MANRLTASVPVPPRDAAAEVGSGPVIGLTLREVSPTSRNSLYSTPEVLSSCRIQSTGGNHSVSEASLITSVAARALAVFCLPILLLTFGRPVASAQCSQLTGPEAASSTQPAASQQSNSPVAANTESSSSSETASAVHFATGTAITVLEDTPLQVINDMPISSRTTKAGAKLAFTVTRDVIVDGILVIPCDN
jgi:hypothetical protein